MRGLCLVLILLVPFSQAFVLLPVDSDEPRDRLIQAPRFSAEAGTWQHDNVHGLDGGLEYVVAPGFCEALIKETIDATECAPILSELEAGLDAWASIHPFIEFVHVPLSQEEYDSLDDSRFPEILIIAEELEGDAGATGGSSYYPSLPAVSTNGQTLAAPSIAQGTLTFDVGDGSCFWLFEKGDTRCLHFATTITHEIGHVFWIGHPDDQLSPYFDTNNDPLDEMEFNCLTPWDDLDEGSKRTGRNVMNSVGGHALELSVDDRAAFHFLYSVCDDQDAAPWEHATSDPQFTPGVNMPGTPALFLLVALIGLALLHRHKSRSQQ